MPLDAFDPDVLSLEEFPALHRLVDLVSREHELPDLLAGAAFADRLGGVLSELQAAIDRRQWDFALQVLEPAARAAESPWPRAVIVANVGLCLHRRTEIEAALERYAAALDLLDPVEEDWSPAAKGWLYNQIAWAHYECGQPGAGVPWAEKAVALNPEHWHAQGTLGSLLYELGDDRAFAQFELAMQNGIDPEPSATLAADPRYRALAQTHGIALPQEG